jgi:hypothetical protein
LLSLENVPVIFKVPNLQDLRDTITPLIDIKKLSAILNAHLDVYALQDSNFKSHSNCPGNTCHNQSLANYTHHLHSITTTLSSDKGNRPILRLPPRRLVHKNLGMCHVTSFVKVTICTLKKFTTPNCSLYGQITRTRRNTAVSGTTVLSN